MKTNIILWLCGYLLSTSFVSADAAKFYPQVKKLCMTDLPASRSQCDALIEDLQDKNDIPSMLRLANAYVNLGFNAQDRANSDLLNEKVVDVLNKVLIIDPQNLTALYGRSTYAPKKERLTLWRRILLINPKYEEVIQSLSTRLLAGNDSEYQEGIQLLRRSYPLFDGDRRWFFAAILYDALCGKNCEQESEAVVLRQQIWREMGIDVEQRTYETAIVQLPLSCVYFVMRFDGADICLESILLVANHGEASSARLKKDRAKLIPALTRLIGHAHQLQQKRPDVQIELRDLFEDIKQTGEQSAAFYLAYAHVLSGKRRIEALQKASRLSLGKAEKPGQAAAWLAQGLVDMGRYDEAIEIYRTLIKEGLSPYADAAAIYLPRVQQQKDKQR